MKVIPTKYSKSTFIEFLHRNNVSNIVIEKFELLPEKIIRCNSEYKLNIESIWYNIDKTYYNFELNYYSEELVEFLFTYKIFDDIEKSINFLLCELINNKYIAKSKLLT